MSTEQYKIKNYSPKFAKKTVTVMRKVNQRNSDILIKDNFDEQVTHFKNVVAKKYDMRIVTSFNERTIYGVVIFDQNQLIDLLVDPAKKSLGISETLVNIVKNQSNGNLVCDTSNRQLSAFLSQQGFQNIATNHFVWKQN
ncbi:hypothetical protein [Pediococcus ethanolidurans]|uniref:N-acetyltransferase domain-containing protein n=1 Tax=Pediococcus ethanolidurans TaxID=319653 RepID=A0A0R2JZA8_9LACO|nr:hypothetical protein [Pediococcus ethanolidurans]KRN82531.1 hypothetical protein IV87_GL002107 [Pediococcus ethanolidurans]MDV7719477.1 hypothetical protein [Pediococcus ethanolidurans]GEN94961.1 hypothetical protein PET01_10110 [Pediococcus ethanolidurans]SER49988.1 hypothetical protein SAMN04487973_10813 [Pediococcus ethanolidurans]